MIVAGEPIKLKYRYKVIGFLKELMLPGKAKGWKGILLFCL